MGTKHFLIANSLKKVILFGCLMTGIALMLNACHTEQINPNSNETPTHKSIESPISLITPSAPLINTSLPALTSGPSPLPADQTLAAEKTEIITIKTSLDKDLLFQTLDSDVDWFILIKDLDSDEVLFEENASQSFNPASMIKVPLAVAVLARAQEQGRSLEDLSNIGIEGRSFSAFLRAMLVHSEEDATRILEFYARGDGFLPKFLKSWGLNGTFFDPRRSSCVDLAKSLESLFRHNILDQEMSAYLLDLMRVQTENDSKYLGVMSSLLPGSSFANKRGTMGNPTIVADHGLLSYQEKNWLIIIAGTPNASATANLETIGASIERFAQVLATELKSIAEAQP